MNNLIISENGCEILLNSIKGFGTIDSNGNIVSGPDVFLYTTENIKNHPFIAPDFYLYTSQTAAVDV